MILPEAPLDVCWVSGLMHPVPKYLPHCTPQLIHEALHQKGSREEGDELILQRQRIYLGRHFTLRITAHLLSVARKPRRKGRLSGEKLGGRHMISLVWGTVSVFMDCWPGEGPSKKPRLGAQSRSGDWLKMSTKEFGEGVEVFKNWIVVYSCKVH